LSSNPEPARLTAAALREALRGSTDLPAVRAAIGRCAVPVLIADRHGRYVAANEAACALTGFTASELQTQGLTDLTGAPDAQVADVLWRAFLEQGHQTGQYTLARKDGSTVVVEYEAFAHVAPGYHASILRPLNHAGATSTPRP
jgi:PAS domain S-box-containing protein